MVIVEVVLVLVVLVFKLVLVEVVAKLLKLQRLAGEPVNGARDQLLLDVLAESVVKLEALLDVRGGVVVVLGGRGRWGEEVEKGLLRDGLLDDTRLLGVCGIVSMLQESRAEGGGRRTLVALLLRLGPDRQVLARLPSNLVALGVVVDEVSAVPVLLLVEVGL